MGTLYGLINYIWKKS